MALRDRVMASGPTGDDSGVTAPNSRPNLPTPRALSNWVMAAGALVVLGVGAVIGFVLLRRYGGQGASVQLDAIRTGGTLVIGTGGAVALLLTARRQRYVELALVHTDRDATERRITELYTKAADQLGSEQEPVRRSGVCRCWRGQALCKVVRKLGYGRCESVTPSGLDAGGLGVGSMDSNPGWSGQLRGGRGCGRNRQSAE
jgi:hypothetical protein